MGKAAAHGGRRRPVRHVVRVKGGRALFGIVSDGRAADVASGWLAMDVGLGKTRAFDPKAAQRVVEQIVASYLFGATLFPSEGVYKGRLRRGVAVRAIAPVDAGKSGRHAADKLGDSLRCAARDIAKRFDQDSVLVTVTTPNGQSFHDFVSPSGGPEVCEPLYPGRLKAALKRPVKVKRLVKSQKR